MPKELRIERKTKIKNNKKKVATNLKALVKVFFYIFKYIYTVDLLSFIFFFLFYQWLFFLCYLSHVLTKKKKKKHKV